LTLVWQGPASVNQATH